MNVAMPMGGGKQQQMAGIDGQEKHGQEQEQENHGHTPTSTGGNRSDWATPSRNDVHGGEVQSEQEQSQQDQFSQEGASGRDEPHVSGEGGSVF